MTEAPFPGGSARWTNIGTLNGSYFDLLVQENPESAYTYAPPALGAQAATSNGFACIGVGVQPSYCTDGGSFTPDWTPRDQGSACVGGESPEENYIITGGAAPPPCSRARRPLAWTGYGPAATKLHTTQRSNDAMC